MHCARAIAHTGYSGLSCQTADACTASTNSQKDGTDGEFYCINGGTIGGTTGSCTCTSCDTGYSGVSCQTADVCTASADPSKVDGTDGEFYCIHGGTIGGTTDSCTCTSCDTGYSGLSCQTPDACTASTNSLKDGTDGVFYCINGGTIGGTTGSCTCTSCDTGYSGLSCQTPDACTASADSLKDGTDGEFYCIHGGTIGGTTGSCECTDCDTGYSGLSCQTAGACTASSDPSKDGTDGEFYCINGGTIGGTTGSCECTCAAGYEGANCQTNIDECASNPCVHGVCTDGINAYTCDCVECNDSLDSLCDTPGVATGFTGDNCDECDEGKGHNVTTGKCEVCPEDWVNNVLSTSSVNNQVSHDAQCALLSCDPGFGQTSDTWNTTDTSPDSGNCIACTNNTVSPGGQGQCVECGALTANDLKSACVDCAGTVNGDAGLHTLTMTDSYTDGWAGATIIVGDSNGVETSHTLSGTHAKPNTGASYTINICDIAYVRPGAPGDYPEERSFSITLDGTEVFSVTGEWNGNIDDGPWASKNCPTAPNAGSACKWWADPTPTCIDPAHVWTGTQCVTPGKACTADEIWNDASVASGECTDCPVATPKAVDNACTACSGSTPMWTGTACVTVENVCNPYEIWKQTSLTEGHCEPCDIATPKAVDNVCTACPSDNPAWTGTACETVENVCNPGETWNQTSLTEGHCENCLAATPIAVDNVCTACPPSKSVWDGTACVEFCPGGQKWDGVSGCVPSGCAAETPRWVDVLGYREAANQVKYCHSTSDYKQVKLISRLSVSDCRGFCNDHSTSYLGHHGDYLYKTTVLSPNSMATCLCARAMEICRVPSPDYLMSNYGYVRYEWGLTEGACEACPGASNWNTTHCVDQCGVEDGDDSCVDACGVPNGDGSTCLDECAPNPCVHGTCTDGINEYTCDCGDTGFTGDNCDECVEGKGHNVTTGKCEVCPEDWVNNQVSHNASCALLSCDPGFGQTSDVSVAWDPTNPSNTTGNCIACTGNTVSPGGQGQCVECGALTANDLKSTCLDACGVPNGDDSTCTDCAGVLHGTAFLDDCGNCVGVQIGSDIDGAAGDQKGYSVSLSGDGTIMAVGAWGNDDAGDNAGHVRVYQNVQGTWTNIGEIDGAAAGDFSGTSVSLSGNGSVVAIGAYGHHSLRGHVRVFQRDETVDLGWKQLGGDIDGAIMSVRSGYSVSLSDDGMTIAIGAPKHFYQYKQGLVTVHILVADKWELQAQMKPWQYSAEEGHSVSLSADGKVVAMGARGKWMGNNPNTGHVRVFQNVEGVWSQIGTDIYGAAANDYSGHSVSLSDDGSVVAIGALYNDAGGDNAGHVRVYQRDETVPLGWKQLGLDIDGEAVSDLSGYSVSLSGDGTILAIGAPMDDNDGGENAGQVRVYQWGDSWTQLAEFYGKAGADQSGFSVSLSADGSTVAIGAPLHDGKGHVRVYSLPNAAACTDCNGVLKGDAVLDQCGVCDGD